MMHLIYRFVLKMHTSYIFFIQRIYLKICIIKGLKVGKNVIFVEVPDFGSEPFLIEIGDYTKLTSGIRFINHDGAMYTIRSMEKFKDVRNFGRIKIGNNCFVGNNCIFLPGSKMGNNCILGAGSVLNSTMPDNSVYAGIPAKFICTIEDYGKKALENNTIYPRELEKNRNKLNSYIKSNLAHTYKPVKN